MLKNGIRLPSFRKEYTKYPFVVDKTEFVEEYESIILPKIEEILHLISSDLVESEIFTKLIIEYGLRSIELDEMIDEMQERLIMLYDIAISLHVPTLLEVLRIQKAYQHE
ncbi:hypothetical protein [Bacillus pseudomycoides]|uniref:hypothetical protein n=1 Tax=Bacillus pseudomycoides TaxID=64104 RepID=UPI000BF24406|nr:hypothetical protein [Bacillus pseudomycoides]PEI40638.1 hypothetical protein CN641_24600 [Bacillus pseudomycoides]PGA65269.1 hypothetical protein COL87_28135 [Bacillus pseudomycoides]PHA77746.1 hypothetical protein COE78_28820 [Bacillus pseudomycoides]PHB18202.1 hypothetical protein COE80_25775 [Bacillus pseudomycoides]PHC66988.1 hypothetical protein COF38_27900 [Bacillus pseudomycoides]